VGYSAIGLYPASGLNSAMHGGGDRFAYWRHGFAQGSAPCSGLFTTGICRAMDPTHVATMEADGAPRAMKVQLQE